MLQMCELMTVYMYIVVGVQEISNFLFPKEHEYLQ